jgi:hypothetical protein
VNTGASGGFVLSGDGVLNAQNEYIGDKYLGSFQQSGGQNNITDSLIVQMGIKSAVYYVGSYQLNGGTVNVGNKLVNIGEFDYTAGTINARIENYGLWKVSGSAPHVYSGTFYNNGVYASDPAVSTFMGDVTIGPEGYLTGGKGDIFKFGAGLASSSENRMWNTLLSDMVFFGGSVHDISLVNGSTSCRWGALQLDMGAALHNPDGGFDLLVTDLVLPNGLPDLAGLDGAGFDVYFVNLCTLDGDGNRIPLAFTFDQLPGNVHATPEPLSCALFIIGGGALAIIRRRKGGK